MQPSSIRSLSQTLDVQCRKLLKSFNKLKGETKAEEAVIQGLVFEIDALSLALVSIDKGFSDAFLADLPLQTPHEQEYWGNVTLAMSDCNRILSLLLKTVRSSEPGPEPGSKAPLPISPKVVGAFKQQMSFFRHVIHFSSKLIPAYFFPYILVLVMRADLLV
jgi:hypothetical protein